MRKQTRIGKAGAAGIGRRLLFWSAFALICFLATLIGLVCLNQAAGKLRPQPRADVYKPIYDSDQWLPFVLKPGARIDAPYGVYGQYSELFARSDATYELSINSQGCRGPEFALPKPPGVLRVVLLGDSSTFGWDTPLEKTYGRLLEDALQQRFSGQTIEVVNAGEPNFSSWFGLIHLEHRVLSFEPDLLLVSFGRNDELDTAFSPQDLSRNLPDKQLVPRELGFTANMEWLTKRCQGNQARGPRNVLRSTALYRLLVRLIYGEQQYEDRGIELPEDVVYRVSVQDYEDNLREIARLARAAGADVLFIEIGVLHPQYREAMARVADELGAPFLGTFDLQMISSDWIKAQPRLAQDRELFLSILGEPAMNSSPGGWLWYTTDFCHPNAMGHAVIHRDLAPLVIEIIQRRLAVGRSPSSVL
ncbi:MAG: GDSL-type esterase/lipase family protein [Candidatus Alcyoniella australis]|nr:GDSL-type esterase/lipase family protein [Candidatus Alcyoniella australis]